MLISSCLGGLLCTEFTQPFCTEFVKYLVYRVCQIHDITSLPSKFFNLISESIFYSYRVVHLITSSLDKSNHSKVV